MKKLGILLIQLGSPKSPQVSDVKEYLREFLGDPRVVDKQDLVWKLVLNLFILPSRSPKSAAAYRSIWTGSTFPLFQFTESFVEKLQTHIDGTQIELAFSYILSPPSVTSQLRELKDRGCEHVRVIPMFPQFCEATTLSCRDALDKALREIGPMEITFVENFHKSPAYINNTVQKINESLEADPPEELLFSFHGYPIRRIRGGDPYFDQCVETATLLAQGTKHNPKHTHLTFQSRFGREPWLAPSTEETIIQMAQNGVKKITVVCPAFVVDNLETQEEVGIGLREIFLRHGGSEFHVVRCLNDDEDWAQDFAKDVMLPQDESTSATPTSPELPIPRACPIEVPEQGCCHAPKQCETCPYLGLDKYPDGALSPKDRSVLKTMFLTLFIDLIGFSIMFPLFPEMLNYYNAIEGETGLFGALMEGIRGITGGSDNPKATMALFGGLLVFLYSFLQFAMAPVFGAVSDRVGRRPILLFSILGNAVAYLIWVFSGSFLLLVISRLLSGLMGSNITTATAAVSDTTTEQTRSKGMAIIGIAFGLGFILGPAIGGLSAAFIPLHQWLSGGSDWGINPFSAPALIAFLLCVWNFVFVLRKFPETLPPEKRGKGKLYRTINPIKLFHMESYPGVSAVVWVNFIFLSAFGAAENMLTFLTFEKLDYSAAENGMLFVFIGVVLSMVQGGYVRRKAALIGESVVTQKGLKILIPGLILIAMAGNLGSVFLLYVGLSLMATGSAMVIPCLTSLVSFYAPEHEQGRIIGVYRSIGALGRTVGPVLGGLLYWRFSYASPYVVGAVILIIPFLMIRTLPQREKTI